MALVRSVVLGSLVLRVVRQLAGLGGQVILILAFGVDVVVDWDGDKAIHNSLGSELLSKDILPSYFERHRPVQASQTSIRHLLDLALSLPHAKQTGQLCIGGLDGAVNVCGLHVVHAALLDETSVVLKRV